MTFSSREEAGRELGRHLAERGANPDVVLGLPRGGMVVGAEVARVLQRPLDAMVVRKLGHPFHREFAVGALAEHGVLLLDRPALAQFHVAQSDLDRVITEETERLRAYELQFHGAAKRNLAHKSVLIVDDGIATGATVEAAIVSARKQKAGPVAVAAPVASPRAIDRLSAFADEVVVLVADPEFEAVGQYYSYFPQTTEEEVLGLLQPRV
jgi:putative phosphoribosyl transferase